jgi:hypothetical protein
MKRTILQQLVILMLVLITGIRFSYAQDNAKAAQPVSAAVANYDKVIAEQETMVQQLKKQISICENKMNSKDLVAEEKPVKAAELARLQELLKGIEGRITELQAGRSKELNGISGSGTARMQGQPMPGSAVHDMQEQTVEKQLEKKKMNQTPKQ